MKPLAPALALLGCLLLLVGCDTSSPADQNHAATASDSANVAATPAVATGDAGADDSGAGADANFPGAIVVVPSRPSEQALADASLDEPLVLRSLDDAQPYYDAAGLEQLKAAVDFDRQYVLLFAWSGSGQDKLTYAVMESYPEQIAFQYHPGRTRDLRRHTAAFALRDGVMWQVRR